MYFLMDRLVNSGLVFSRWIDSMIDLIARRVKSWFFLTNRSVVTSAEA